MARCSSWRLALVLVAAALGSALPAAAQDATPAPAALSYDDGFRRIAPYPVLAILDVDPQADIPARLLDLASADHAPRITPLTAYSMAWYRFRALGRPSADFCSGVERFMSSAPIEGLRKRVLAEAAKRAVDLDAGAKAQNDEDVFDPERDDADAARLRGLTQVVTAPEWLRVLAGSVLELEAAVRADRALYQAITSSCATKAFLLLPHFTPSPFEPCSDDDLTHYGDRRGVVPHILFDLLRENGVKSFQITCATVAIVSQFAEVDEIVLSRTRVLLNLQRSRIGRLVIDDSTVLGLDVSESEIAKDVALSGVRASGAVDLSRARIGRLTVSKTTIDSEPRSDFSLSVASSEIDRGVALSELTTTRPIRLENLVTRSAVEVMKSRINTSEQEQDCNCTTVSLGAAGANFGHLHVSGSVLFGTVILQNARGQTAGIASTYVHGGLDLSGAKMEGLVQLGSDREAGLRVNRDPDREGGLTVNGDVTGTNFAGNSVQARNAYVVRSFELQNARLDGGVQIHRSIIGRKLVLVRLTAQSIDLNTVSAPVIDFGLANVGNAIELVAVRSEYVDGFSARANYMVVNRVPRGQVSDTHDFLSTPSRPLCVSDRIILAGPTDETHGLTGSRRDNAWLAPNGIGCVGALRLAGANITASLEIEGDIRHAVDLNSASVGRLLTLASVNARYAPRACVQARSLKADTIVFDLNTARVRDRGSRAPAFVDLHAPEFRILRPSEPESGPRHGVDGLKAELRPLLGNGETTCSAREGVVRIEPTTRHYQPAIYDAVSAGYERTGDLDYSRFVKILKNRAYADSLAGPAWHSALPERILYAVADCVNSFGYNNVRAVLVMLGLILFGFALSVLHLYGPAAVARIRRAGRTRARRARRGAAPGASGAPAPDAPGGDDTSAVVVVSAQAVRRERKGSLLLSRTMFSIDRGIPSLGLDQEFGSHKSLELPTWLSAYFYFQRTACFLIIVLMLAGAFNIFQ